ncbi:MAG: hypothetical protein HY741_07320 [Chloroflexi bacterium]|nr:hypothetical protein [Chloroflexota bacterium]
MLALAYRRNHRARTTYWVNRIWISAQRSLENNGKKGEMHNKEGALQIMFAMRFLILASVFLLACQSINSEPPTFEIHPTKPDAQVQVELQGEVAYFDIH